MTLQYISSGFWIWQFMILRISFELPLGYFHQLDMATQ